MVVCFAREEEDDEEKKIIMKNRYMNEKNVIHVISFFLLWKVYVNNSFDNFYAFFLFFI